MFERNRVDNSLQQTAVAAEVTLLTGEVRKGRFVITASRSLADVLNGDGQFMDFEPFDGHRAFIAKSQLVSVKPLPAPSAAMLPKAREQEGFNPHAILGVAAGSTPELVRQAYVALAKTYHPDRYAGVDLPAEVRDYVATTARRINAAYEALDIPVQSARRAAAEKSTAVYTSPQRP